MKPLHALAAYVSFAMTTDLNIVCIAVLHRP